MRNTNKIQKTYSINDDIESIAEACETDENMKSLVNDHEIKSRFLNLQNKMEGKELLDDSAEEN